MKTQHTKTYGMQKKQCQGGKLIAINAFIKNLERPKYQHFFFWPGDYLLIQHRLMHKISILILPLQKLEKQRNSKLAGHNIVINQLDFNKLAEKRN